MNPLTTETVRTDDQPSVTATSRTRYGSVVAIGLICPDVDDHMVARLIRIARAFDRVRAVQHGNNGENFVVDIDVQYIEPDQIDDYVDATLAHLLRAFDRALTSQSATTDTTGEIIIATSNGGGRTSKDRGDRQGRGRRGSH